MNKECKENTSVLSKKKINNIWIICNYNTLPMADWVSQLNRGVNSRSVNVLCLKSVKYESAEIKICHPGCAEMENTANNS